MQKRFVFDITSVFGGSGGESVIGQEKEQEQPEE